MGTADRAMEQFGHLSQKLLHRRMVHILNRTAPGAYKVDVGDGISVKPFFTAYGETDNGTVGRKGIEIPVDRA